ncbi:MAG: TRAP transporter large permease [Phycisphaeraceae bacterium]
MDTPLLILTVSFVVFLLMNVPVAFSIGMASLLAIFAVGFSANEGQIVAQRMSEGIQTFALLAIPFFILAGVLMGRGGMAHRLIAFAGATLGWLTGGLGYVNTLTCMLFGSISGSATAAVSATGGFMIPEMNKRGYGKNFNVAVTTTAATTGLLIPPSNVMIVYAVVAGGGVSVGAMFMAGILPGILVGLSIMAVCFIISRVRGYGGSEATSLKRVAKTFVDAAPSLLLVVIVLGGILWGWFTATEAAAIAVAYAFLLTVVFYREVKLRDLPAVLLESGKTTAIVMLLVGTSQAMSWVLTYEQVPQDVSAFLLSLSDNPIVILLIINIMLLLVGTFMDMTPAVLIFTPILLPVAVQLGLDPVHFGMLLIANLCIGLCTPPVGTCLFVGCGVGKTTIADVTPSMIPFYIAMVVSLLVITYWPPLSLWLPRQLGLL